MRAIIKHLILFLVYGSIYFLIETIYRIEIADWRMFIMGGILAVLIGLINNLFTFDTSFVLQCYVGMLMILLGECVVGSIINADLSIWNYSSLPLNFVNGQICVIFAICWFGLSGLCIILDDYLRWKLFGEEKPHYKL